ncbi:hypothetical protein MANES_12G070350v8 [Manihot esculenta]|uniref:Uncharacterized protein n=1 Tax=Manihot esculenta TaxID=3983 RepID=A0ACB7GRY1_MANES|nr:hypothetical protein MANES_12G070350v8 [Manihot esculenta]
MCTLILLRMFTLHTNFRKQKSEIKQLKPAGDVESVIRAAEVTTRRVATAEPNGAAERKGAGGDDWTRGSDRRRRLNQTQGQRTLQGYKMDEQRRRRLDQDERQEAMAGPEGLSGGDDWTRCSGREQSDREIGRERAAVRRSLSFEKICN